MSARKIIFILSASMLMFARVVFGDEDDAAPKNTNTVVTVQIGKLQTATLRGYLETIGTVGAAPAEDGKPEAMSIVSSPEAATVSKVEVWEGKKVGQGEELLRLDSTIADVAVEFAQKNLERQQKLLAMSNTSQKAAQDAQQQLAVAEAQRQRLILKSPLAGTVIYVHARSGEAVDPSKELVTIVDLDRMVITASVPTSDARELKLGQSMELESDPPVTTPVSFISPVVDTSNDTVWVRGAVPTNSGLRLGQFVHLRIVVAEHTNCLAAPEASVVTDDDNNPAISVVTNDTAAQVKVTTGLRDRGLVEVSGPDLKDGETVVTVGAYGLPAHTKIKTQAAADK